MTCRAKLIATAVAVALLAPESAVPDAHAIAAWNKPCWKAYWEWKKKGGHKAFAMTSTGSTVGQSCATSWGAPSKAAAEKDALKRCRGAKWGSGATCYVTESQ